MKRKLLVALALLAFIASCGGDENRNPYGKHLTSKELRDVLSSLDSKDQRVGIQYGYEFVNGVPVPLTPVRVQDKSPQRATHKNREELIEQNKKRPIEDRATPDLLEDFNKFSSGLIPDQEVSVIVLFVDDLQLPQLPEPDGNQPKDSEYNTKVAKAYDAALKIVKEIRSQELTKRLKEIPELSKVEIVDIFTLINAVELRMHLSEIKYLIHLPDVQSMSYKVSKRPLAPPQNAPGNSYLSGNNISDARKQIDSDLYYSYVGGWIGLLDTGAAKPGSHVLLQDRYFYTRDCVNGTSDLCRSGSGLNPWDEDGHGSFSASILSGTNALGDKSRGVSNIIIDSFKVYKKGREGLSFLDESAAIRAFYAAYKSLDKTILAEMQGWGDYKSALSEAANNAFDLGVTVVAAAGNYGPKEGSIASPANARKVLAFGAYDVQSYFPDDLTLMNYSGRGPTKDFRVKPDLITPTNTRAADIHNGNRALRGFGGTSGSSPYGAAAAALMRNFIISTKNIPEPGLVYAALINGGSASLTASKYNQSGDNHRGAGNLRLPTNGYSFFGSAVVGKNVVSIPLAMGNRTFKQMRMAIWWPEDSDAQHKNLRIGFRNFDCGSWSGYWPYNLPNNVWQKYISTKQCNGGTWYLQIIPENVFERYQKVYYHVDFSNHL